MAPTGISNTHKVRQEDCREFEVRLGPRLQSEALSQRNRKPGMVSQTEAGG